MNAERYHLRLRRADLLPLHALLTLAMFAFAGFALVGCGTIPADALSAIEKLSTYTLSSLHSDSVSVTIKIPIKPVEQIPP